MCICSSPYLFMQLIQHQASALLGTVSPELQIKVNLDDQNFSTKAIHVIFSPSQIGRFGISQREIGVSDREIFAR